MVDLNADELDRLVGDAGLDDDEPGLARTVTTTPQVIVVTDANVLIKVRTTFSVKTAGFSAMTQALDSSFEFAQAFSDPSIFAFSAWDRVVANLTAAMTWSLTASLI